MKGLIHIYCGDGKGKTTAAIGLAVRAAGRGKRVVIARFLKNDDSGEVGVLERVPGITLIPCRKSFGFTWNSREKGADLLVLDEALGACSAGMIREERLLKLLDEKPEGLEVVLTGRSPSEELLARGDYVTRMEAVRHPYEKGIGARAGVEY